MAVVSDYIGHLFRRCIDETLTVSKNVKIYFYSAAFCHDNIIITHIKQSFAFDTHKSTCIKLANATQVVKEKGPEKLIEKHKHTRTRDAT